MRRSRSVSCASGVMCPPGASATVLPGSSSPRVRFGDDLEPLHVSVLSRLCPRRRPPCSSPPRPSPQRIDELAAEIDADLSPATKRVHLVCVLKGGFIFLADLVRRLRSRVTLDFIAVSSYAKGTTSSGEVRLLKDLDVALDGKHVIIVEDIVDTGLTLTLSAGHPARPRPEVAAHGVPPEQALAAQGRRPGRVHRLHHRRPLRRRLRPRLRGPVSPSARHRRAAVEAGAASQTLDSFLHRRAHLISAAARASFSTAAASSVSTLRSRIRTVPLTIVVVTSSPCAT